MMNESATSQRKRGLQTKEGLLSAIRLNGEKRTTTTTRVKFLYAHFSSTQLIKKTFSRYLSSHLQCMITLMLQLKRLHFCSKPPIQCGQKSWLRQHLSCDRENRKKKRFKTTGSDLAEIISSINRSRRRKKGIQTCLGESADLAVLLR